jgi:hypothetical protein
MLEQLQQMDRNTLQQRLFLCASIFFNAQCSEQDLRGLLKM